MRALWSLIRRPAFRWCGCLVFTATLVIFWGLRRDEPGKSPDRSSLVSRAALPPLELTSEATGRALASLRWSEIASSAACVFTNQECVAWVLSQGIASTNPPARYLSALLLTARGEGRTALGVFGSIPVSLMPPEYLYAPHRLWRTLHPGQAGPYLSPLRQALAGRQFPPLLEARLRVQAGDLREALEAYLRSDPAKWTQHDITLLGAMGQHDGVASEANRLLRASLRSGRVSTKLQVGLRRVLEWQADTETSPEFVRNLADYLRRDPIARTAAVQAVTNQFNVRRTFLQRRYGEILNQFRASDPLSLPDETLLLLLLSSAREADLASFDCWSQELKRRQPSAKVRQWIHQLKADIH